MSQCRHPDDVLREQARVERADALGLVFPIWWYGMPATMKSWLNRVGSTVWAYDWRHDPTGSLLNPRSCTFLVLTGVPPELIAERHYDADIDNLWRHPGLDYRGVDPIDIHLLPDAAFETGAHNAHLHTAYQAGLTIGRTASSSSGKSK